MKLSDIEGGAPEVSKPKKLSEITGGASRPAPVSQPGFGEKLGGFAYGATKGLLGSPGEAEHFLAHTVPEYMGWS